MTDGGDGDGGGGPSGRDIDRGFMFVHNNATEQLEEIRRLSAHVYALTELLVRDGVVRLPELEAAREATHNGMMELYPQRWLVARVQHVDHDKYDPAHEVPIDCVSRLPLCRAACCRLDFYLAEQDLLEGVVRWDFIRPYHIKKREDGYCVHCSADGRCEVWPQRPGVCRTYDCRSDARIWQDFEARIPSPALAELKAEPRQAAPDPPPPPLPSLKLGK